MNKYKSYQDYLDSEEWKKRRIRILIRDGFHCQLCGTGKNLRVHHIHYADTYGMESDDDLITVCDGCHQSIHNKDIFVKQRKMQSDAYLKRQIKRSSTKDWVIQEKYRDFLYGGSENMCSLKLLKESQEKFCREHQCEVFGVTKLQYPLGHAHWRLVNEMSSAGYSARDIELLIPLDSMRIKKYLSTDRSACEEDWNELISISELRSVVRQYIEDLNGN